MTPAFQFHVAAIAYGFVDKKTVIGLRKALNALSRDRDYRSATFDEIDETISLLDDRRPIVIGDLHESGLKQLRNRRYRNHFTEYQREIIASENARFRLCGYEQIGSRGQYATPIYRIENATTGDGFRFINVPWQSGGNGPEVL